MRHESCCLTLIVIHHSKEELNDVNQRYSCKQRDMHRTRRKRLTTSSRGVKFPVREGDAVVAQLKQCLADRFISRSQYDEAINAILAVDRSGSTQ